MSMPWNPAAPPSPGEWAWSQPGGQATWGGQPVAPGVWQSWWGGRNPYTGDPYQDAYGRHQQQMVRDANGNPAWWGGVEQSYRYFEPDTKASWEAIPQLAYQQFTDWGFGDRERPLAQYARGYYQRAYADAMAGELAYAPLAAGQIHGPSNGPTWVDYLTPELVYTIRQSFNMQSASNRGVVNQFMPAGRQT